MAGTHLNLLKTEDWESQPCVILVKPQLGENIGAVARAMLNCNLYKLRIVSPREEWPNAKAYSVCSGADIVLDHAEIFDSFEDSISDLQLVFATTARIRDMIKPVISPSDAARHIQKGAKQNIKSAYVFGPERTGLHNNHIALADAVINIPLNPAFSSLNLAQSVLLVSYHWHLYVTSSNKNIDDFTRKNDKPAQKSEILNLFERLETLLIKGGFLRVREKRPRMIRNIRNIFIKASLTQQETDTLHGIVSCLLSLNGESPPKTQGETSKLQ